MKRFVWRLQRVLDIKKIEEQTKRVELLKVTEKLVQTQGELLLQKRILENTISDIADKKPDERLGEQEFFLKCSAATDELIKKLKSKLKQLEAQQRKKIAAVIKAKRFKEGLEKLRAQAKEQFIKQEEKLEQKELDEGCTLSFARKIMPRSRDKVGSLSN